MKAEAKAEPQEELKLSCREARLLLKTISLTKKDKVMGEEEKAAARHYAQCKECCDLGLAEILGKNLSCREILLVWAKDQGALWLGQSTLEDRLAVEHLWGKYKWQNSMGGHGFDIFTGCRKSPCAALADYWRDVPLSSQNDGASGVIHLIPFLIRVFLQEKWSLEPLLMMQKSRMRRVLDDLEKGKVTISGGHYYHVSELAQEVQANIEALQKLVLPKTEL